MKILVTGGAGFIGSVLVNLLSEKGFDVRVLDSFLFGSSHISDVKNVDLMHGDVRDASAVCAALDGVDAVVHLAGIVGEPACNVDRTANLSTNIISNKLLFEAMTNKFADNVNRLIYVSSCSVYGNVQGMYDAVDESTPTMPLSTYAAAKLESERMLFEYAALNSTFSPTVLRLTTIFGWSPRPRADLVTNAFALNAMKGRPIPIYGGGGQYRSLIHVHDVASAVLAVLESPRYAVDRQIFHVGDENNNKTVAEIAELVKKVVPETVIKHMDGMPADRRDYRIQCNKICNALHWQARFSVEDGIRDFVDNARKSNLDLDDPLKYRNDKIVYK